MIPITDDKRMLGYELLSAYPNISHFATTRLGGYSKGAYAGFNCSPYCGDDDGHVTSNQALLCEALPQYPSGLIIPRQVHGTEVCFIDSGFLSLSLAGQKERLDGIDAVVTNEPGFCLCVSTADCVPLLIYDRRNNVVAAVHAGWRGTVECITAKVLSSMNQAYGTSSQDVVACMRPSISLSSFEVGEEVYATFQSQGFDMQRISVWRAETKKHHIDLWEANRMQLLAFGVPAGQIACAEICTYIHHEEFFSARRLGICSGRMLSGIMINR